MRHLHVISRAATTIGSYTNGLDAIESFIVLMLTVFFRGWDNYSNVISNLTKYYRKT